MYSTNSHYSRAINAPFHNLNGATINMKEKPQLPDTKDVRISVKLFCFDISRFSGTVQFLLCCAGVFVLYLIYGYLQELIFTLDGFKPYGWYLTLIQFAYYAVFGVVERMVTSRDIPINEAIFGRSIPFSIYCFLALLTLGTMGLSNSSLGYLNYPTQVIFKCCKLVPVLVGSILILGKKVGPLDFLAAIAMCIGLAMFTLADSQVQPNFNSVGVLMISLALICDALIGNVQEKAMRTHKAPNHEVVFFSYSIGLCYLFLILLFTGDLAAGFQFCRGHLMQTYGMAFFFSLSGYLGIQIVLQLVRTCGATLAATVTTARKAVTIVLSFVFFSKPFTPQYIWSGLIVVLGIYLNVFSKKYNLSFKDMFTIIQRCLRPIDPRKGGVIEKARLLQNV